MGQSLHASGQKNPTARLGARSLRTFDYFILTADSSVILALDVTTRCTFSTLDANSQMQYLLMKSDEFRRLRRDFDLIEETGNLNINHGSKLLHKFNQANGYNFDMHFA